MYKLYFHKILSRALYGLATSFLNKIKVVQQKVYENNDALYYFIR